MSLGRSRLVPRNWHRRVAGLLFATLVLASHNGEAFSAGQSVTPDLTDYARWLWRKSGRSKLAAYTGVSFDSVTPAWRLVPGWEHADQPAAPAYYAEPLLRGALALAEATDDEALYDEVASFYLTYLGRFTTIEALNRGVWLRRGALKDPGLRTARTLAWRRPDGRYDENPLRTAQVLAPAGRLIRDIARKPDGQRSAVQLEFVRAYVPLLAREHVVRLAAEARWDLGVANWRSRSLLDSWTAVVAGDRPRGPGYALAVHDRDLWLIDCAVNLLMAAKFAPHLVKLESTEQALVEIAQAGVKRLEASVVVHAGTVDWRGRLVGSAGYFEAEWVDYPDMRFAGDSGPQVPTLATPSATATWDMSHLQRLPVVLRDLWVARDSLALGFPSRADLEAVVNQYLYVAFQGDLERPRFNNFFDGKNGWYRVGFDGNQDSGYPPSTYCDSRVPTRPCLTTWAISGWMQLACISPALDTLALALVRLANADDAASVGFRERYYTAYGQTFAMRKPDGRPNASLLLGQFAEELLVGQRC